MILTIVRLHEWSEREKEDDNIEILPKRTLVIKAYVNQKKIHRVLADNGSSTDILYEHCFRQLPAPGKKV